MSFKTFLDTLYYSKKCASRASIKNCDSVFGRYTFLTFLLGLPAHGSGLRMEVITRILFLLVYGKSF